MAWEKSYEPAVGLPRNLHPAVPDAASQNLGWVGLRAFRSATGLPPHQFLITRRVERAQQILRGRGNLSLAEVAIGVGFSDQSQLCFHFKRIVGLTPGRFRASAKST
jgi:methylphosphotriester-DNA--protein-cysteine methyltransferase